MKIGVKVCDAMTRKPVVVSSNINLKKSAKVMLNNKVGSLIVKESDDLVGLITEKDFISYIANGIDFEETLVKDVMTRKLVTVKPSEDIFTALDIMIKNNVRRLPVMDDKLVGLITHRDILKIAPQLFEIFAEKIRLREESNKPIFEVKNIEGVCEICGSYSKSLNDVDGEFLCNSCKDKD